MSDERYDSIRAAERLAQSSRLRAVAAALWPFLAPGLALAAGWVGRGIGIADQLAANTAAVDRLGAKVATLTTTVEGNRIQEERRTVAIGRQAAYATAGFQAYEPTRLKEQKRTYAEKYATAYRRLIDGGKGPEDALAMLFDNIEMP